MIGIGLKRSQRSKLEEKISNTESICNYGYASLIEGTYQKTIEEKVTLVQAMNVRVLMRGYDSYLQLSKEVPCNLMQITRKSQEGCNNYGEILFTQFLCFLLLEIQEMIRRMKHSGFSPVDDMRLMRAFEILMYFRCRD